MSYIVIDGEEREAVCPTGAMTIKNETDKAWEILRGDKESTRVVVQIAPALKKSARILSSMPLLPPISSRLRKRKSSPKE